MDEQAHDDEAEIQRLVRFLLRPGPRFGLAMVVYRDPVVARSARERIEDQALAGGFVLRTLSLDYEDATKDIVARMAETARGADALFLTGMDSLLIDGAGRPAPSPSLMNLNIRRDKLPELIDARIVLWMSKAGYRSFRGNAWDLHEVILTVCELERSAVLPLATPTFLELPPWFRAVGLEQALAIKNRADALTRTAASNDEDSRTSADAASSAARAYLEGGWLEEGSRWLERAADTYERLGDLDRAAAEHLRLAEVFEIQGELERARGAAERARDRSTQSGNGRDEALAVSKLADVHRARGELDLAMTLLRSHVLPLFERLGDAAGKAATMVKLADDLQASGRIDEALELLQQEVLPLYERLDDARGQAATAARIARILEVQGELERSMHLLQEVALPLYERVGAYSEAAEILGRIAGILTARKEHDRAQRLRAEGQLSGLERSGARRDRERVAHKLEESARLPVVLLAFAEAVEPSFSRKTVIEEHGIRTALEPAIESGKLGEVITLWLATVEGVVDTFHKERLRGRIRVLHLGGHADTRAALTLTSYAGTQIETHSALSLADYLGHQDGLILVVLNGCSTMHQVTRLRHAGVKAVVGTSAAITDEAAAELAARLYAGLTAKPLKLAFEEATAFVQAKHGGNPSMGASTRLTEDWGDAMPWVLSCDEEYEGWRLVADDDDDRDVIDDRLLADELANVIHDSDMALLLLSRAGLPRRRVPNFTNALVFWSNVLDELRHGATPNGVPALVREVAALYPGNRFFRRAQAILAAK